MNTTGTTLFQSTEFPTVPLSRVGTSPPDRHLSSFLMTFTHFFVVPLVLLLSPHRGCVRIACMISSNRSRVLGEKLVKMETGDRREVMHSLAEEGWTHKHILEAAIPFKRTAWLNRDQQPAEIGLPRKICPELEQVVDTEYRASSSETSIVMKRLSKQRNSTVTIQNVLPPHGSIYANSVLKGVVSHTTYRRMRPDQYRKLACQTDVCNCCLAGQGIRKKLTKLIKGVERKLNFQVRFGLLAFG